MISTHLPKIQVYYKIQSSLFDEPNLTDVKLAVRLIMYFQAMNSVSKRLEKIEM